MQGQRYPVGVGVPGARAQGQGSSLTRAPTMTQRQKDNLALPSAECQAVESGQAGVETWKYKAKNSLMYYPEGERRAGRGRRLGPGVWIGFWECVTVPLVLWAFGGPGPFQGRQVHLRSLRGRVAPPPEFRLCSVGNQLLSLRP